MIPRLCPQTQNIPLQQPTEPNPSPSLILPISKHPMQTRSKSGIFKPKTHSATASTLPTITCSVPTDPISTKVALKFPEWQSTIDNEFNALQTNKTWSLVPLQDYMPVVGCR